MISATDLRSGVTFSDGKDIFQVLSYEHIKLGRGTANIKVKVKNLKTGAITEKSFISGAKVEEASVEKKETQYLYNNNKSQIGKSKSQNFVFMDRVSFEQFELTEDGVGEAAPFLKEGMEVKILFWQGIPLSVELPIKMGFKVKDTGPVIRGNSAVNIYKEAILENGLKLKVPLFIKVDDTILVDTRTGVYVERVEK